MTDQTTENNAAEGEVEARAGARGEWAGEAVVPDTVCPAHIFSGVDAGQEVEVLEVESPAEEAADGQGEAEEAGEDGGENLGGAHRVKALVVPGEVRDAPCVLCLTGGLECRIQAGSTRAFSCAEAAQSGQRRKDAEHLRRLMKSVTTTMRHIGLLEAAKYLPAGTTYQALSGAELVADDDDDTTAAGAAAATILAAAGAAAASIPAAAAANDDDDEDDDDDSDEEESDDDDDDEADDDNDHDAPGLSAVVRVFRGWEGRLAAVEARVDAEAAAFRAELAAAAAKKKMKNKRKKTTKTKTPTTATPTTPTKNRRGAAAATTVTPTTPTKTPRKRAASAAAGSAQKKAKKAN
ncbi:hypothetical protein L249_2852 [Ophiocordyceps polyrhachis-furcata BCC 54312]|uniref:Uncharacterized protein n=1 Tax=Ophiocordyceps polyrhachis-furcata BCC 54312 TaxID=1330021 RepID=A0A367LS74_9HYPO|nr:hypothetical protein L249_2852 [Ophiocordyceps polyrhachis-furcata BCC 54312]